MSQVTKNLIYNLIALLVNVLISIWYIPYLVNSLGIIAYGVLPLALLINQYISILATSLTSSLTRFYSISIKENNLYKASSYLSGALLVIIGIIIAVLPVCIYIVWYVDEVFNIPPLLVESAKVLFIFTFLNFTCSLITNFLSIIFYSENRLDILNKINIIRQVSKVLFNIVLFEYIALDIKYVGIGNFLGEFIVLIFTFIIFRSLLVKGIVVSFKKIDKMIFSSLFIMTMWVIIHQLGDMAIYKSDILFVNKMWGTKESGILGALSDFGSYVMLVIGVVSSLFGPLILIAYSNKDHEEVKILAINNSLIIGLITAIMCAVLIGYSTSFLSLWLGEDFSDFSIWLDIKLFTLPFYAASGVFAFVYRSWNKVKLPAMLTVFIGVINVAFTYVLCINSNLSHDYIIYILVTNFFLCLFQTFVLGSFMVKSVYPELKSRVFIEIFFKILILLLIVITISKSIERFYVIINWFDLIICFGFSGCIALIIGCMFLLNEDQRKYLFQIIKKKS
jgi:membrane protein EpsK